MTDAQAKQTWITSPTYKRLSAVPTFQFFHIDHAIAALDTTVIHALGTVIQEHPVVWEENGQWFHTDETWTDKCGPFQTELAAEASLAAYCREVLGMYYGDRPPSQGHNVAESDEQELCRLLR